MLQTTSHSIRVVDGASLFQNYSEGVVLFIFSSGLLQARHLPADCSCFQVELLFVRVIEAWS